MSRNFRRMKWTASVLAAAAFSGCAQRHGQLAGDPFLDSASPGGRIADMPSTAAPRAGRRDDRRDNRRDERTAARHETINRAAPLDDAGVPTKKNDGRSLASRGSRAPADDHDDPIDRSTSQDGEGDASTSSKANSKHAAARPTRDPLLALGSDRKSRTDSRPTAKPLSRTALAASKPAPDFEPDDESEPPLAKSATATSAAKPSDDEAFDPRRAQSATALADASPNNRAAASKDEADPFPDDAEPRAAARSHKPNHPLEAAANEPGDQKTDSDIAAATPNSSTPLIAKPSKADAVASRDDDANPFEESDTDDSAPKRRATTSSVAKTAAADDPFLAAETWSRPTKGTPRDSARGDTDPRDAEFGEDASNEAGPIEPVVAESDAGSSLESKRAEPASRRAPATLDRNPFADLDDGPADTSPMTTARRAPGSDSLDSRPPEIRDEKPAPTASKSKRFDAWDLTPQEPTSTSTSRADAAASGASSESEPRAPSRPTTRPTTRLAAKPPASDWDDEEPEEALLRPSSRSAPSSSSTSSSSTPSTSTPSPARSTPSTPRSTPAAFRRQPPVEMEPADEDADETPSVEESEAGDEPTGRVLLRDRGIAPMSYQFEARPPRKATPAAPAPDKTPPKASGWKPRGATSAAPASDNPATAAPSAAKSASVSPAADTKRP